MDAHLQKPTNTEVNKKQEDNILRLKLVRFLFTSTTTISRLYIDDVFECYILEDVDRGLDDSMTEEEIKKRKVYGKTAIPTGIYLVINSFSPRFKKYLPLVLNVKGYKGIRIHPGNTARHTEGCLLPGSWTNENSDVVTNSRKAFSLLHSKLKAVEKKKNIILHITRESVATPDATV